MKLIILKNTPTGTTVASWGVFLVKDNIGYIVCKTEDYQAAREVRLRILRPSLGYTEKELMAYNRIEHNNFYTHLPTEN